MMLVSAILVRLPFTMKIFTQAFLFRCHSLPCNYAYGTVTCHALT